MKLETKTGIIERLSIDKIGEEELKTLLDIQKDAWAFFIGEYVSCLSCGKIHSKKDIYSKKDKNYSKKTVIELEEEYGCDDLDCIHCGGETEFLRGNGVNNDMGKQLFNSIDSYVVVLKNKVGRIIGFSYAYVDKLSDIYDKEFYATFKPGLLKKYNIMRNQIMLSVPGTCMEGNIINIEDIFSLITSLSMNIDDKYKEIIGVFEAIVGTSTYNFFKKMGGKSLNLLETGKEFYTKDLSKANQISDIIFHPKVINDYRRFYGKSILEAIKNN